MFDNATATIYDGSFTLCGGAPVDFQPYDKIWEFEDGFEIRITKRAFCDLNAAIIPEGYIGIGSQLYKIMNINPWDDYLELWLYACKRGVT